MNYSISRQKYNKSYQLSQLKPVTYHITLVHALYPRLVDPALSLSREAPVLIVRSGCILFSVSDELLSVKAVIAHDELLLFEPSDGSFPASQRPGIKRGASRLSDSGPQGPLPWAELARKLEEGIAEWAADTAEAGIAASSCACSVSICRW